MKLLRGAIVGAALLTACATTEKMGDRVNPEMPSWFTRPSGDLTVFARRTLTTELIQTAELYEHGRPAIDPAQRRVFVGSSDRGLYALRSANLSTIWRFETAGRVQSEPTYDAALDVVFFGSNDGGLYAVRAADGTLVWRFDAGSEVSRKPIIEGETLVFANASDQLFAIDRRTGKSLWQVRRAPAAGMELAGYAGPAVDHGKVYFAYSDGNVGAYDLRDGSERWSPIDLAADAEQHAGGREQRYLDVDTTPVVADVPGVGRIVLVASYAGGVFALDADSGARVWSNNLALGVTDLVYWVQRAHAPHPKGPNADTPSLPERRLLFATSAQTGLWALDVATGRQVWRSPIPDGGITAPVVVAGTLVFGTSRYGLFMVAPENGKVIDAIDSGTGFVATPSAYGNRVFALSNGGVLYGLAIDAPLGKRN